MGIGRSQPGPKAKAIVPLRRLYDFLAPRAYSAIILGALFCTLLVKFFHAWRNAMVGDYFGWILDDVTVLLSIEVVLLAVYFRWPGRWVFRIVTFAAALVCTWSVMSAGLLIRKGMQILPTSILPLFRDPLNAFSIVGHNLVKMPVAAVILLGPSAIALAFFFYVLVKAPLLIYSRRQFVNRILICLLVIFVAVLAPGRAGTKGSPQVTFEMLRYNCQFRAVTCLVSCAYEHLVQARSTAEKRKIPAFDEVTIELSIGRKPVNHNIVIVVLEGVQYRYTSLADGRRTGRIMPDCGIAPPNDLTPHLLTLANEGVEFVNSRSSLTHTTKTLFSLLTGRYPSVAQDLAETVPVIKPYASLATILKQRLNFRTAFFQSAKGNFESRPGLVCNLGFDKFWARDDLNDPNAFIGYLACDEFSMLKPIVEWIKAGESPFLLTILCSVTHDPYEVPDWFGTPAPLLGGAGPAREPVQRYRQAIFYTDKFIAALDTELTRLNLADKTIFCVIGDHGEAFGEHGLFGHQRIAFEEVLRVPWIIQAPSLVKPGARVTEPVSSVDLTPTLLALLGFETEAVGFDGVNALGALPETRKVYFSCWMQQGPAGFVRANRKFIYSPTNKMVSAYDLDTDPLELVRMEVSEQRTQEIADEIFAWRKNSVFRLDQQQTGEKMLFDSWLCRWNNRVCSAKYRPQAEN